jgi:hypothetical protein
MKTLPIKLAAVAAFLTMAFAITALTETVKKTAPANRPPAAAKPAAAQPAAAYQDQGFAPGFDDLMTMLVQPRHIRLYYAGAAKNWELAAAESRDLRASFGRIAQTTPKYEGDDVSLSMGNFMVPKLDALDAAIAVADSEKFAAAYKGVTQACNECHTYMEHPYLVIQNPNAAAADRAHSDQKFNPSP